MLKNYFKIAIRQIFKNKAYAFINIGGLAIGLSAVLLIGLYVQFEFSYDADLSQADNLYRVNITSYKDGALVEKSARTSPAMGSAFSHDLSAVDEFTRVVILGEAIIGNKEDFIWEKDIFIADDQYFDFFDCSLVEGYPALMQEPLKVMISEETAAKIFKDASPVGKTLNINSTNFDGTVAFDIVGVFKSPAANRHLKPQILISYATLLHFIGKEIDQSYDWINLYTYLKLSEDSNPQLVERQMNSTLQKHHGAALKSSNTTWKLGLQPIKDIHTNMAYVGEYEQGVDGKKLSYFTLIAIFVLMMIYVNSINITNAKAINRSKEVGIRKVSGGSEKQLFYQFILESLFMNLIAIVIALVLVSNFGPLLIDYFELNIPASAFSFSKYYFHLLGLWIFGSFASGLYPAIILTSFSPSRALKGSLKFKLKGAFARPLTIAQLVICLLIIAGTLIVYLQLDYMREQELGITLENKIVVRSPMLFVEGSGTYRKTIRQELMQLEGIRNVAATNEIPGSEVYWRSDQFFREAAESDGTMYTMLNVGDHYFDVFEIQLKAGKAFNTSLEEGSEAIINEKARQALGFENNEAALGQKLMYAGWGEPVGVEIVGVVDNYRQQGANSPINPTVLNYSPNDLNYYIVDIGESRADQALPKIKATYSRLFPNSPFEYYFLDEHYDKQYRSEKQFAKLFSLAALVTIFIAIMGILGVTTQLINQRNKEVSIRKILGASVSNIFRLIFKEYLVWLLVCYVIAIPTSYYLFSAWLDNFLVRISLGWWFFTIPAFLVAIIFMVSTVYQTIKTALVNPAETLKND